MAEATVGLRVGASGRVLGVGPSPPMLSEAGQNLKHDAQRLPGARALAKRRGCV